MNTLRLYNVVRQSAARLRVLCSLSRRQHSLYKPNPGRYPLNGVLVSRRNLAVEASTAAVSSRYVVNVDNRGMLTITWADGETAAFHAVWLRHNCQCPSCVTSANQKTIYPSMLNPKVAITSITTSGLFRHNLPLVYITSSTTLSYEMTIIKGL